MSSRSSSLLRLLLAGLPIAAPGGAAVVPLATLSGCACGDQTTVLPISKQDYDSLLKRYGSDGVPASECKIVCVLPPSVGSGGSGGGGGNQNIVDRMPLSIHECRLTTIEFDTPAAICTGTPDCGGAGRRPSGLLPPAASTSSRPSVGAHFARAARLEAASVPAFLDLAFELRAHGAPDELARACERAAADEIAHARLMTSLARRHGAEPLWAHVGPRRERDLEAMALENAIEGCVHEAFGASLLAYQARHADDPMLRAALASVAIDEARHARLSTRIHAWAVAKLDAPRRRRLAEAQNETRSALARANEAEPPTETARGLGLPSAERAQTMIAG